MTNAQLSRLVTVLSNPEFRETITAACAEEAAENLAQMRSAVAVGNHLDATRFEAAAGALEQIVPTMIRKATEFKAG